MSKISKNQAKNHAIKQQFAQTTPLYPLSNAQFTPKKHLKTQYHFSSKNESGRSMVEILGVLAIIGVLSIGAVYGYQYAFAKYRANDVIHAVNMRASDIYHRLQAGQLNDDSDFSEWSETTETGFPIFIDKIPNVDMFQIEVDEIPTNVCKEVMKDAPIIASSNEIKFVHVVNGETIGNADLCETDTDNTKALLFTSVISDTDANGNDIGECVIDGDCSSACGESVCDEENGYTCTTGCGEHEVCNEETATCEEIKFCVDGQEFRSQSGACISCLAKGSYEISSKDEPWIDEELNIEDASSGKTQCDMCGRSVEETGGKTYCSTVCLNGKGYVPLGNLTNKNGETQYTEPDYLNGCVKCDNPYDYAINEGSAEAKAGCAACGHSTYKTNNWPSTLICGPMTCETGQFKYYPAKEGSGKKGAICISCDDSSPRFIGNIAKFKTMCEDPACGRKVVGEYCVPASCGKNEFLSATYTHGANNYFNLGGCQSCTDMSSYWLGTYKKNTNETTGEITYIASTELQYFINQCESCNDTNGDGVISEEEKDSVRKININREGIGFCIPSTSSSCDGILGKDGTCYSCKTKKVEITSDSHSGCTANCKNENGVTTKWVVNGDDYLYCMNKCAGEGVEFQGIDGNCHDCSLEKTINGIPGGDLKKLCKSCPNRMMTYDYCAYIQSCEVGKSFRSGINGECLSCNSEKTQRSPDSTNCNACQPVDNVNKGHVYLNPINEDPICVPKVQDVTGLCSSLDGNYTGAGNMFRGDNGKCYNCDTEEQVRTGYYPEQCKICGNMRMLDGNYCLYNNGCNSGSTFWSVPKHTCIACSTSTAKIETSYEERHLCDACSNKRSMTLISGSETSAYCVKKCSDNQWQDANGNCYACTNTTEREIGTDDISRQLCTACGLKVTPIYDADETLIGYKCTSSSD